MGTKRAVPGEPGGVTNAWLAGATSMGLLLGAGLLLCWLLGLDAEVLGSSWRSSVLPVTALLLLAITALVAVWQRNRKAQYRALFRAEAARRLGDERYRTTLMSLGDGVVTIDPRGNVELLNPEAEALTGWTAEEARGRPAQEVLRVVDETTGSTVEPDVRALVSAGGGRLPGQALLVSRSGDRHPVSTTAAPILDEEQTVRGFVLVFHDQTADRTAQEALRRSEAALRESQRVARIGHYSLDTVAGTWTSSEVLSAIFGIDDAQPRDLSVWVGLVADEWRTEMVRYFQEDVLGEGRQFDREYVIVRPSDGARRWVHGLGTLRYEGGVPVEMFGTIQDITERKDAEAAAHVDRQAAELERSSLEEQLRQAQKMESIGRLAGGVAHDFNNLLCVIVSCAELAMESQQDDQARDDLQEILRAAKRGAQLTRQLLAFSRRQVLQPVLVDPGQILSEMGPMLSRLLGEDVALTVTAEPGLRPVLVDPGQIEQAVMNLAVNARDAMPRGGSLTIRAESVTLDVAAAHRLSGLRPGPAVVIRTTDTGCGMGSDVMGRLFEPFFTTKERGKGTGLGLATAYGIVRQSGGDMRVTSRVGVGSTFEIFLPCATGSGEYHAAPAVVDAAGGTETVLVVEDEEAVRSLVTRILAAAGYSAIEAASGTEALELARTHPVELLLTDVVMPGMGGRELANRMAVVRPDVPVLFMSGYTDDALVQHGAQEPGTHLISKPFTAAELTARVRAVLDAHQAAGGARVAA
ncbi:MAG: hypothetical protein AMXMBFR64_54410 [Myxococcales bacterium]